MKAKPVKIVEGEGYVQCPVSEATHVTLNMPSMVTPLTLPVILKGKRDGTGCWTWNGDTEKPTLKPSILTTTRTKREAFRCHSWINDGQAQFLSDCTHNLKGQTIDLNEVE